MKMPRWLRLASLSVVVAGTITVALGATYEQVARRSVRHHIRVPGRLVALADGRRLQLDCRGTGAPTIVLESGLDQYGSLAWAAVHDSIARTSRTCAYSRAGIMWSDPAPGPFDSRRAARDLRAALVAAGERAPWVMVGHSIGAAYVMVFTRIFGREVSGVVFVDGSHPDQFARFREVTGKAMEPSSPLARVGAALAWTGLVRMMPQPPTPAFWPAATEQAAQFLPTSVGALVSETQAALATLARAGEMRSLGDRPLRVLTAGRKIEPAMLDAYGLTAAQGARLQSVSRALHDDQATWSRRSRHDIVEDASHYIQFDRPDVVIVAVREVVTRVRSGERPE